jgi:signal transduction histidine kinase
MTQLISRTIAEVRANGHTPPDAEVLCVVALLADATEAALLDARARGCTLSVEPVDPLWRITGHRLLLLAALANLLQNAFKFTLPGTQVTLRAHATDGHVNIEVADHCGGLPPADAAQVFRPFSQRAGDKTGLGLGLAIARQGVEADGGTLCLRNLPGTGCVFTIRLPLLAS